MFGSNPGDEMEFIDVGHHHDILHARVFEIRFEYFKFFDVSFPALFTDRFCADLSGTVESHF